jgi:hypothetical protein
MSTTQEVPGFAWLCQAYTNRRNRCTDYAAGSLVGLRTAWLRLLRMPRVGKLRHILCGMGSDAPEKHIVPILNAQDRRLYHERWKQHIRGGNAVLVLSEGVRESGYTDPHCSSAADCMSTRTGADDMENKRFLALSDSEPRSLWPSSPQSVAILTGIRLSHIHPWCKYTKLHGVYARRKSSSWSSVTWEVIGHSRVTDNVQDTAFAICRGTSEGFRSF